MKISILARFARAFLVLWLLEEVPVLSTTWNDLFCSCVDDVSICWHMLNFVFLCPKRWFQFNSSIVGTRFSSIMTLSNWEMIAEPRSYIFRWRSRFRRHRVCWSSLVSTGVTKTVTLQIKNLIGRVGKNNRAEHGARAARPLERVVLFKTTTWSNQIYGFDDNTKRANNTRSYFLYGYKFSFNQSISSVLLSTV